MIVSPYLPFYVFEIQLDRASLISRGFNSTIAV